ncbi:hypothetical protein [Geomonas oryzae]|uniref:hypothetical protein n=1 Tax=Geomonas oryzae TaxID=2364273 RepID=UPI00100B0E35|nr:hypothetical protein [Geomonas oryzae]
MKLTSPDFRILHLALLVATAAFFSYGFNAFKVTSDTLFIEHQLDSERLVLDGLLHGRAQDGTLTLGKYDRPGLKSQDLLAHELYAVKNRGGEFTEYQSQYGLQLILWSWLAALNEDVRFLQSACAMFMALVVAGFFVVLAREFSLRGSLCFCAVLVFSPWVVIFARNLYWVEATWFLPALVSLAYGKCALHSPRRFLVLLLLLFASLLMKFLCGYEYITTIVLAAFLPLAYYASRLRLDGKRAAVQTVLFGITALLAFGVAATIHVRKLGHGQGLQYERVADIARKRLATGDVDALAREACRNAPDVDACSEGYKKNYGASLTCSPLLLVGRYLHMPHFLPWEDRIVPTWREYVTVQDVTEKMTLAALKGAVLGIGPLRTSLVAYKAFGGVAFPLFVLLAGVASLWRRDSSLSCTLVVSALAPLSWFILAKGHSYIHLHLNYVLWYLLFVPWAMLSLFHRRDKGRSTKHG